MSIRLKIIFAMLALMISVASLAFLLFPQQNLLDHASMGLSGRLVAFNIYFIVILNLFICFYFIRLTLTTINKVRSIIGSIAVGYFENKINTDDKSEMGDLFRELHSMQLSIADNSRRYEQQLAETEKAYFNLEKTTAALNELNTKLEALNASIRVMLNALDQGLFSFGPDGICSDVFSKSCLNFLGGSPAQQHVGAYLKLSPDQMTSMNRVIKMLFSTDNLGPSKEGLLDLLPMKFTYCKDKSISLNYRLIMNIEKVVQSVLVVATDHTAEETALKLMREQEAAAQRVLSISRNRNLFLQFFNSLSNNFSTNGEWLGKHKSLEDICRDIHTLKGNASIFFLNDIANILNDIENRLANIDNTEQAIQEIKIFGPALKSAIAQTKKQAYAVLGKDYDLRGMTRTLPIMTIAEIGTRLKQKLFDESLYNTYIETFMGEPIHDLLRPFNDGILDLAERFEKKILPCRITGENFQVLTEIYQPLFATFSHIFRNIISHAIEEPEIRADLGKAPELSVIIDTRKYLHQGNPYFSICFEDDGRGIDVALLRKKLKDSGNKKAANDASDNEVMQYIFRDNFSTKESVDELSGRGVGLSAIKCEVDRLGGSVRVESKKNSFTRFIIEVPMLWD